MSVVSVLSLVLRSEPPYTKRPRSLPNVELPWASMWKMSECSVSGAVEPSEYCGSLVRRPFQYAMTLKLGAAYSTRAQGRLAS